MMIAVSCLKQRNRVYCEVFHQTAVLHITEVWKPPRINHCDLCMRDPKIEESLDHWQKLWAAKCLYFPFCDPSQGSWRFGFPARHFGHNNHIWRVWYAEYFENQMIRLKKGIGKLKAFTCHCLWVKNYTLSCVKGLCKLMKDFQFR